MDQVEGVKTVSWLVPRGATSVRLDTFIRSCLPHLSRRELDRAIGVKLFLVNGAAAKKGHRLAAGDRVVFSGAAHWLAERPPAAGHLDLPIVFEDASILALDKPAGMATHGFSACDRATIANLLAARWPKLLNVGKSRWEPGLVHRLDVETSGLVLVAKTQAAFHHLRAQFRRRELGKTYWALVWGDAGADGVIDFSLVHDHRDKRKMSIVKEARSNKPQRAWRALTYYRKLGAVPGMSLLEIEMVTGVTHQIRVHLAAIGHPIVGDGLYGHEFGQAFDMARHFLHAKKIEFFHPEDGRRIKLVCELPGELRDVLARIGIGN